MKRIAIFLCLIAGAAWGQSVPAPNGKQISQGVTWTPNEWKSAWQTKQDVGGAITSGTINGVTIGGTTPATGTFTNVNTSGAQLTGSTLKSTGGSTSTLSLQGGTSGSIQALSPMTVSGGLRRGANYTYATGNGLGPPGSTNTALDWVLNTLTGTVDTGSGTPFFYRADDKMTWNINASVFTWTENLLPGYDKGRVSYSFVTNKTAAAATPGNYGYVGNWFFYHADAGDGGTSTSDARGEYWNLNPDIRCNTGDWIASCFGAEWDLRVYAGTNANLKVNQIFHYGIGDATHGALADSAVIIDASPTIGNGTGKGLTAISFGQPAQDVPWDTTASIGTALFRIYPNVSGNYSGPGAPSAYIDDGFDLPELFVRGNFIDNGRFKVSGQGAVTSGNLTVADASTGSVLSTPGVIETSATVVSGGSNAKVGSEIVDSVGGIWEVATISGSAVSTVTLKRAATVTSCPASPTATTMFGAVTQPTLNISCSTRDGLTVQAASKKLGFYGATPVTKPAPTGACAGNTGCQALRNAMVSLGLIDGSGITD